VLPSFGRERCSFRDGNTGADERIGSFQIRDDENWRVLLDPERAGLGLRERLSPDPISRDSRERDSDISGPAMTTFRSCPETDSKLVLTSGYRKDVVVRSTDSSATILGAALPDLFRESGCSRIALPLLRNG